MSKKVLFIDRDGTLVIEPPVDYQLDSLEKLEFYPKVMRNLGFIRSKLDFEFAMVTNQDGLGTASFPEETFWPAHNLMMKTLEGEGITFDEIFIDRTMPEDMAPTRKPRTGMLTKYLNNPEYDLAGSFVIGDRPTIGYFMASNPRNAKIFSHQSQILNVEQFGFIVAKNNKTLLDRMNKALREAKQDGSYQAVMTKWFGQ